jgi:hypothetical protein
MLNPEFKEMHSIRQMEGIKKYSANGGTFKHFLGKKHTEETKRKIGSANSIHQKGKNNNQYGTCWIYNLEIKKNKKIKRCELDDYLSLGWIKGRKMKFGK